MERKKGSPLESSSEIGITLPFHFPPYLLLLALPWCWEKNHFCHFSPWKTQILMIKKQNDYFNYGTLCSFYQLLWVQNVFNFYFFEKLKERFCLRGPHLVFSVRSPLFKEGVESEANNLISPPPDRKDPVTWAELRLQSLLRSSQRLSIALLISPTQKKAQ